MKRAAFLALLAFVFPSFYLDAVNPKNKVILTVHVVVHASAQRPLIEGAGKIKDEFSAQLNETVEYEITEKLDNGRLLLETLSHENSLSINGSGSFVVEGIFGPNVDSWTYLISPKVEQPQAWISDINSTTVKVGVANFYSAGNGRSHGSERYLARVEGDTPIWETTEIKEGNLTPSSPALNLVFDKSLRDSGKETALDKKLQAPYTPRKDGGFFTSGNATHFIEETDETQTTIKGSVEVSWSVQCGEGPERVKAVIIAKDNYKAWVPEAGTSPGQAGNTITFEVQLLNSSTGAPAKEKTAQFEFELDETSNEPGSCGNSPWTGKDPDIQILRADNPDLESIERLGQAAKSRDKQVSANVTLACYDGAGRTSLKVIAHTRNAKGESDEVITAYLKDGQAGDMVAIPFDENSNTIADAWEESKDVKGKPADEDEDEDPPGDRRNGDGLTIWEEYRGFLEDGRFIRTNPKKKDFFICDTIGGRTKPGIDRFESLTKLDVHDRLTLEELDTSRVINRNHSPEAPHKVDQHGVRLEQWSTKNVCKADGGPGTPGTINAVLIDLSWPDFRSIFHQGANQVYASLIPTVAHELLHCCNVWHHGGRDENVWWHEEEESDGTKKVYEFANQADCGHREKGTVILVLNEAIQRLSTSNFTEPSQVWLGVENGQHSGDEDCVMRYACADAYKQGTTWHRWYLMNYDREIIGQKLCVSEEGTGVNLYGRKPRHRYGDADRDDNRGNCADKICVNDLYQEVK